MVNAARGQIDPVAGGGRGPIMKEHAKHTKGFRELTLRQMRASIASTQGHLKDMKRVYEEVKKQQSKGQASVKLA